MYAPSTSWGSAAEKPIELTRSRAPGVASVAPAIVIRQWVATAVVSEANADGSTASGISVELFIDAPEGAFTKCSMLAPAVAHAIARPLIAAAMAPSIRAVRPLIPTGPRYLRRGAFARLGLTR